MRELWVIAYSAVIIHEWRWRQGIGWRLLIHQGVVTEADRAMLWRARSGTRG